MNRSNPKNESSGSRRDRLHPLAEVFGFPYDEHGESATRHRNSRLCPFNNKVPNCTKDKANDPLGVCSIYHGEDVVITCPVRFRESWLIAEDAADFFFPLGVNWTSLSEVRLKDKYGGSAGNIDMVLVSYDDRGKILDFGALEIQAVYISGNVRKPFQRYMTNPSGMTNMDWSAEDYYPNPDFLSSSRKRLAPQLLYKGGILNTWGKKSAVALDSPFFRTLPALNEVDQAEGEIAWLIYDLVRDSKQGTYKLQRTRTAFTKFDSALATITKSDPGPIGDFLSLLQEKLDDKLENPPDAPLLGQILGDS